MNERKAWIWHIALVVLCLALLSGQLRSIYALAQAATDAWAPLTKIYTGSYIDRPMLATDATGALHVLWWGRGAEQAENAPGVIMYARSDGAGWTQPTDVIVAQLEEQIPFYRARLAGWAQVNYPYASSVQDALVKLQYDLYYIKHQSLYLDLVITLKTIGVVLTVRGT